MENACANIITANPADVILFVLALVVLVVMIWCIWAFFYAVFSLIFSKWDKSKFNTSVDCVRYMIIWLFLTVMLLFMCPTLLKLFRVPNYDDYNAKNIFVKVGNIVSCFTTWVVKVITDYPNNNPFWSTADPLWTTQSSGITSSKGLSVYDL